MNWNYLFSPAVIIFMIPIVAILAGLVTTLTKKYFRHRDRMAMIAQGMHPDYPLEDESEDLAEGKPPVVKETTDFRGQG